MTAKELRGARVGLLIGLALLLLTDPRAASGQAVAFKVIVNESNPMTSMSRAELSEMFLKKNTTWPSGRTVLPVDLTEGSPVRETFSQEVHGRTVARIEAYWQQKIFTGRGVPPPQQPSDAAVIQYVAENPDAVGYISGDTRAAGVRVVALAQ
jgi:ABC-type phosphate transport system substrate-binding protein